MKRYAKHAAYAAIALVFLWSVAWMLVAQRIVREVGVWRAQQAFAVDWDSFDVKGWPFGWRANVGAPRATGAGWAWSGARLVAHVAPWNPGEIRLGFSGEQRAAFGATTLAWRAARFDALVTLDGAGGLAKLDVDAEAIEASPGGAPPTRLRKFDAAFAIPAADLLDARVAARGVRLPGPVVGFGPDVARAELTAQLRGPRAGASFADAVRAWRDAGGTLEVTSLALDWGALRLAGDGTLALDERDRPLGAGTMRAAGWSEAIDAFQAARAIEPVPAALLKAALNFLGRVSGGEPGTVRVPIAAQDGRLVVHRIPVANLPSLRLE